MNPDGRHTIHAQHCHFGWNHSLAPVLTVTPGSTVTFTCQDASGGQITAASTAAHLAGLDFARINPVSGPVRIDGAEPGDTLAIRVESFAPSGFGWTAILPGFGLLADDFSEPHLHLWSYDRSASQPAAWGRSGRIPIRPFAGTMGLAPAAPGHHSVVPPRRVGGNMDIRDLTSGSTLYLPVEVTGALFSVGDTHAAQGDGEVCGTAIESPMEVVLHFDVIKRQNLAFPRFTTPGGALARGDAKGWDATTGIGPDLMQAARDAVRGMIDLIGARHGIAPADAYMLCSVAGDLRISEIVDQPNWVISFHLPRAVLE